MSQNIDRFLEAQTGAGGIGEALKQIQSGRISGDWFVWTFPVWEFVIRNMISEQSYYASFPDEDERFLRLREFAMVDKQEAEAFISNPTLRANLERICVEILKYDTDAAFEMLGPWMGILWSSLSIFEKLHPESTVFHELREILIPDNVDVMSLVLLEKS